MDRDNIVYLILKILADGKEPKKEDIDSDMSLEQWGDIAESIDSRGLAKGVTVIRGGIGNKAVVVAYNHAKISDSGLSYIKNYQ